MAGRLLLPRAIFIEALQLTILRCLAAQIPLCVGMALILGIRVSVGSVP
jgi:hypothetical protein